MGNSGYVMAVIRCEACESLIPLSAAGLVGAREVRAAPDPFLARCPQCLYEATYLKSAIRSLEVKPPR